MKKIIFLGLASLIFGCKSQNSTIVKQDTKTDTPAAAAPEYLTGKQPVSKLQNAPYDSWFGSGFSSYAPNQSVTAEIKKAPLVDITIYMGTWCGDSQEQVPRFYKILEQAGINADNVTLIAVDREKKTPQGFENGLNITNVPTFIFRRNGTELGRIVETPVETLEKDMLKIITGQPYKHQYEH